MTFCCWDKNRKAIATLLVFAFCSTISQFGFAQSSAETRSSSLPSDVDILDRVEELSDDQLVNFYVVYRRLKNEKLSHALMTEARRRSEELGIKLTHAALRLDPNRERIHALITQGKYREVISELESIRREEGLKFAMDRELAESYGAIGKYTKAREAWNRILNSSDTTAAEKTKARDELELLALYDALRNGYALLDAKRFDEAIAAAENAVSRFPGSAEAKKFRQDAILSQSIAGAYRLLKQKRFDEALAVADSLLESFPEARDVKVLKYDVTIYAATEEVYELMRRGERSEALVKANVLLATWPQEPEIKILQAQALAFDWRFEDALPRLLDIKNRYYKKGAFPGEGAIGDCYISGGKFPQAIDSYKIAVSNPTAESKDVLEMNRMIEELNHELQSFSETSIESLNENGGEAWMVRSQLSQSVTPERRIGVRGYVYDAALNPGLLVTEGATNWGMSSFIRQRFQDRFFGEARVGGGSFDQASAGFTVGRERFHRSQSYFEAFGDLNQASVESLQPIALDAVEDLIGLRMGKMINQTLFLTAGASGRSVSANHEDLGDGYNLNLELKQTIVENAQETNGVYVAYRGTHQRFSGNTFSNRGLERLGIDPAATIITEEGSSSALNPGEAFYDTDFDPHGLVILGQYELKKDLFLHGSAGALYDFSEDEFIYQLDTGLAWRMSKSSDLNASLSYFSEGSGAANESGSSVFGSVGVRLYF